MLQVMHALFGAVRRVAVADLHPLGVALTLNALTKVFDGESRSSGTDVGGGAEGDASSVGSGMRDGSGWEVEVDRELLAHLLEGVRRWPEVPPAAGRSGGGEEGGWQLQSQVC